MTFDDFCRSLAADKPPTGISPALTAMWWDAKGHWSQAHESAQADESSDGSWVHAYLHRKEGDASNAGYWYSRASHPACRDGLEAEWRSIVTRLLET